MRTFCPNVRDFENGEAGTNSKDILNVRKKEVGEKLAFTWYLHL